MSIHSMKVLSKNERADNSLDIANATSTGSSGNNNKQ
jgi:hypothetical protein